jgi:hypothetical protein
MRSHLGIWIWATGSLVAAGVLAGLMLRPDAMNPIPIERTVFLPGTTTDGHYQIELDCDACHGDPFSSVEQMQKACLRCHGAELEAVDDSHPQRKFTDPRNAERVAALDARWCVTCHREHRPEVTGSMGLSLPGDYCHRCHQEIGEDRATHVGLPFGGCASSGCHNFHDNTALYEDFLVEHRDEPDLAPSAAVPDRELLAWALARGFARAEPLGAAGHDAPGDLPELARWVADWEATSHAKAAVGCRDCHAAGGTGWDDRPSIESCERCHAPEVRGFGESRHGMRLAAGLGPMRPGLARRPMHPKAADRDLDCNACHPAHAFDTRIAAADACLGCHADEHSLAWEASPHASAWAAERAGAAPSGTGVSCATCHLPRVHDRRFGERLLVAHNQNDSLRPNEKMIRAACLHCHGLGFALDALADGELVARNFRGRPRVEVESIHYAAELRWKLEGRAPPWQRGEHEQEEPR